MYVSEVRRRRYRGTRPPEVNTPQAAVALLRRSVSDWSKEHFLGAYLDARHHCLIVEVVSIGSLSASIVHPREVFKPAVLYSAAGIIVGHNHPSGSEEPSPEDISVTRRLVEAGHLLGIELLDHIVFTQRTFLSMKERGVI